MLLAFRIRVTSLARRYAIHICSSRLHDACLPIVTRIPCGYFGDWQSGGGFGKRWKRAPAKPRSGFHWDSQTINKKHKYHKTEMGTIFTQQPQNVPVDIAPVRPKSKRPREEQHTPPIFQREKKYASSEQMDLKLNLGAH